MLTTLHRLFFFSIALLCLCLTAAFGASPEPPRILTIRTNAANLLISVSVPKGWQAVMLESRDASASGAWIPRAVARAGLGSCKLLFKVPVALKAQLLRAQGALTDALPKKF